MLSWHTVRTVEISWPSRSFIIRVSNIDLVAWLPFCSCIHTRFPKPFPNITCMKAGTGCEKIWGAVHHHGLSREEQELSDGNQILSILVFYHCNAQKGCCEPSGHIHTLGTLRRVHCSKIRFTPLSDLKPSTLVSDVRCLVSSVSPKYLKGHCGTRRPLIFV